LGLEFKVGNSGPRRAGLVDRCKFLKVREERHAGELRRLSLAFLHDFLKFLGAEQTSISAHEYAIFIVDWHTFSFQLSGFMVSLQARWDDECLKTFGLM
jgi:hypothetical protein